MPLLSHVVARRIKSHGQKYCFEQADITYVVPSLQALVFIGFLHGYLQSHGLGFHSKKACSFFAFLAGIFMFGLGPLLTSVLSLDFVYIF